MCRANEGSSGRGRVITAILVFGGITLVGGVRALPVAVAAALICLFPYVLLVPVLVPAVILSLLSVPLMALYEAIQGRKWLRRIDELDEAEAEPEKIEAAVRAFGSYAGGASRSKRLDEAIRVRALDRGRPSRGYFIPLLDLEAALSIARDATDPLAPVAWYGLLRENYDSVVHDRPRKHIIEAWARAMTASNGGEEEAVFLRPPQAWLRATA